MKPGIEFMSSNFIKSLAVAIGMVMAGWFLVHAADAPRARSPLEGTWQWDFKMPDGGEVTPRLRFRTKDGELTGTSRFRRGSETALKNISLKGGQVSFDVVRERDEGEEVVTHYRGRLSGDTIRGKITSRMNGTEQSYDWVAKRVSALDGRWTLALDFGGDRPFESRLTLKQEGEKLSGKLAGWGGERDIHRGRFKEGKISFEVERGGRGGTEKSTNRYYGNVVGDRMEGKVEMNNRSGDRETNFWDAVRAD